MNILPKKRWHVRTKDNIARVRRDEAAAKEEEKKRQDKLDLAESEARINFLRRQSGLPERKIECASDSATTSVQNTSNPDGQAVGFDLFADYKTHIKTTNKDLEKEQKEEQEKYEKQIGYLTYLGQDTNEALKVHSWYEVAPKRRRPDEGEDINSKEKHLKQKLSLDPLTLINALIPSNKKSAPPDKKTREKTRTPSPKPVAKFKSLKSKKRSPSPKSRTKSSKSKKHKKDKKNNKKHKKKDKASERKELIATAEQNKREKLEKLRKERLRREAAERLRSEALFALPKVSDAPSGSLATAASTPTATPRIVQKYNSQFNPEIAKQNMV